MPDTSLPGTSLPDTPITPTVDFDRDGVQHGFLNLPHSRDQSAWGSQMIPITVIKNGDGPTAVLTGANHGDEYEGPVALLDLARSLDPADVTGRVIIIPMMNYPAFRAAKRTSPIDGGNLNRAFPGDPQGTITQKIADYFERFLIPMADVVLDIHSGGKTLEFVPFVGGHILDDKTQEKKIVDAMAAFAAPYSMMMLELDAVGMYDISAEQAGKVFVTTELGGGGTVSAETAGIAKRGVSNLLVHSGLVKGEVETSPTQKLEMPDGRCFVISEHSGLFEPCVALGAVVKNGDLIARIYDVERTGTTPVDYHAKIDGVVAGRHFPGLIGVGDFVSMVAVPV